jgi:hypothetical protein
MLTLLVLLATLAVVYLTHRAARGYVRSRLRFVDAVQNPAAPWLAGAAAALLASVLAAVLPFVGLGAALSVGFAVGTGVAGARRDARRGYWVTDGV